MHEQADGKGANAGAQVACSIVVVGMIAMLATKIEPVTVRSWGVQWITERKARGVRSADNEESLLEHHVFPELGERELAGLTKNEMIGWVRALPKRRRIDSRGPLSPRTIHHIEGVTRRLFAEAVDRGMLDVSPCTWRGKRDLPARRDTVVGRQNNAGFTEFEVRRLITDARIPPDRRLLWALSFLTGLRSGEIAVRRWRDLDTTTTPLGRLQAATTYDSRHYLEARTVTNVDKIIPVHPVLGMMLRGWKDYRWGEFMGRDPTPDDLIVPRKQGGPRTNTHNNKRFQADVARLGLREGRTQRDCKATFQTLALLGGASREHVNLITQPASTGYRYTRLDLLWPMLCRVIQAISLRAEPTDDMSWDLRLLDYVDVTGR